MKKRMFLVWLLMLCLLLSACGSTPTETPTEPPAEPSEQETSLPPESSVAPAEKPEPTEPKIYIIEGYSLEELGYSVVFPEQLAELKDPNECAGGDSYFQVTHHKKGQPYPEFLNGTSTTIDIFVADDKIAYNSYTMRILQCYKLAELQGEKDRIRIKDEYFDLAAMDYYQIYRNNEIIIYDLTDFYYQEGMVFEQQYFSFYEYLPLVNFDSHGYDNSWLLEQYNYFGNHITEIIYDAEGNSLIHYERMKDWQLVDGLEANDITFRLVNFKNDPVPGLYIDIVPRMIVEPGEKRIQVGADPVISGYTDKNGELVWNEYFPCIEGEEYLLTVTSATIGNQNYTNTSSYVLPDLSKLEGSYTAEYLWEQIYDSSTVEHQFWDTLEGYWNGPKNRFVIFGFNEKGQPVFCPGLYDAGGGRGYGTVTGITQNNDGATVIEVYYPEHPESVMLGYLPAETITVTINSLAEESMNLQYSDYNASSFYRAGADRETAYEAYAALNHNW